MTNRFQGGRENKRHRKRKAKRVEELLHTTEVLRREKMVNVREVDSDRGCA